MEHVIGPDGSPDGDFEEFQKAMSLRKNGLEGNGEAGELSAEEQEAPVPMDWFMSEG